ASMAMARARPSGRGPTLCGRAEALPFAARSFDGAMAVLTIHHWPDPERGLAEARRVTDGPVVVLTWDPAAAASMWMNQYFPARGAGAAPHSWPTGGITEPTGAASVGVAPIPRDCLDGFSGAF